MARDEDSQTIPAEIRSLIERRVTFQGWLGRVDELGSDFRPEVTARVRADYEERLAEVEAELAGHRTVLESSLGEHRSTLEDLLGEHDSRTAELEECDLRHEVGEYDDDAWERRRKEHRGVLDGLEAELASERAAVGELEGLLTELSGTATPPAADETGETEAAAAVVDEVAANREEEAEAAVPSEDVEPAPFEEGGAWAEEEPATPWAPGATGEGEEVTAEAAPAGVPDAWVEEPGEPERDAIAEEGDEFMDELEFLESLSLDDTDTFDAVSAMLEENGEGEEASGDAGAGAEEEPEESA